MDTSKGTADHSHDRLADFRASRDEVLTRRMRSAKATGVVPMWPTVPDHTTALEPELMLTTIPGEVHAPSTLGDTSPGTAAPDPAMHTTQWALAVGIVAILLAIVLVVLMMDHRAKYSYRA